MKTYKHWVILDEIPRGWVIDSTAGSPLGGHIFITNGKSVLNGQERALLKAKPPVQIKPKKQESPTPKVEQENNTQIIDDNYVRTVNDLARAKFKERILNDVMVDLMVCEIEGWDKMEYIRELQSLIGSIGATP